MEIDCSPAFQSMEIDPMTSFDDTEDGWESDQLGGGWSDLDDVEMCDAAENETSSSSSSSSIPSERFNAVLQSLTPQKLQAMEEERKRMLKEREQKHFTNLLDKNVTKSIGSVLQSLTPEQIQQTMYQACLLNDAELLIATVSKMSSGSSLLCNEVVDVLLDQWTLDLLDYVTAGNFEFMHRLATRAFERYHAKSVALYDRIISRWSKETVRLEGLAHSLLSTVASPFVSVSRQHGSEHANKNADLLLIGCYYRQLSKKERETNFLTLYNSSACVEMSRKMYPYTTAEFLERMIEIEVLHPSSHYLDKTLQCYLILHHPHLVMPLVLAGAIHREAFQCLCNAFAISSNLALSTEGYSFPRHEDYQNFYLYYRQDPALDQFICMRQSHITIPNCTEWLKTLDDVVGQVLPLSLLRLIIDFLIVKELDHTIFTLDKIASNRDARFRPLSGSAPRSFFVSQRHKRIRC